MNERMKQIINNLPDTSGVYIFRDENNRVIYVGKAASLKKRVRQYFSGTKTIDKPVKIGVATVKIDYIETDTPSDVKRRLKDRDWDALISE